MSLERKPTTVKSFRERAARPGWGGAADFAVLAAVAAFLFSYFPPRLLLSPTVATGGDMASHYYTAAYLRDVLLPQWKISGWCPGNFCGFPLLEYYFPLPFLVISALSAVLPLTAAFKIGTALGTFLLPLCVYGFMRLLGRPFPQPAAGAALSLVFLFMGGNSMWGGNVGSTMAGEFCYSMGFSLSILWLGLVFRAVERGRGVVLCAALLAATGLSHAYALLYAASATVFFLATRKDFARNSAILMKIHALAFLFMGFWILPLLSNLKNTTRFNILWLFFSWAQVMDEVFPPSIRPLAILSVLLFLGAALLKVRSVFLSRRRERKPDETGLPPAPDEEAGVSAEAARSNGEPGGPRFSAVAYLAFLALWGLLLYLLGYRARVVDVRFLPFFQFFLVLSPALLLSGLSKIRPAGVFALGAITAACFLWTGSHEGAIRSWIRGNYEGFEAAPLWPAYSAVNNFLRGAAASPRAAYEHSMVQQRAGTVRAFESLPLFSGRPTLEGVYIQASLTAPFIFYLQSEISQRPSTPIPDYNYSRFNLARGVEHLRLMNASYLIAAEPETQDALDADPDFARVFQKGPYGVYAVKKATGRFVEALAFKPVLLSPENFRYKAYEWFRLGDLKVIPIFADNIPDADRPAFVTGFSGPPSKLPAVEAAPADARAMTETVTNDGVLIRNAPVGRPLLVKVSFHKGWRARGADGPYLAGPGFMVVIPRGPTVQLRHLPTAANRWGLALTLFALLLAVLARRGLLARPGALFDRHAWKIALPAIVLLLGASVVYLFPMAPEYPVTPFNKAIAAFTKGDFAEAARGFRYVMDRHPQTLIVDEAAYHYAMCFYRRNDWAGTLKALDEALALYPETRRAAEILYHKGLALSRLGRAGEAEKAFRETIRAFPDSVWAGFSRDRLREAGLADGSERPGPTPEEVEAVLSREKNAPAKAPGHKETP